MKKMKNTEKPYPLCERIPAAQMAALRVLTRATGDQNDERLVLKVFSIGLYVLGLDPVGDFAVDEFLEALHGKDAPAVGAVSRAIGDAGSEAWTSYINVQGNERERFYGMAAVGRDEIHQ